MCGILAVSNHHSAASVVRLGLHNLQHRGEEAVGISTLDGNKIHMVRKRGWVGDVITDEECSELKGDMAIGHVRYSTEGGPAGTNTQPLFAQLSFGPVAIAHNGHIANAKRIRRDLEKEGAIFQTSSDTEIILHLMARSKEDKVINKFAKSIDNLHGAFSLVLLTTDGIIVARDRNGIRPLVHGTINGGKTKIVASESCAIEVLGGEVCGDVPCGSISYIEQGFKKKSESKICIFEYVYFARPDSVIENTSVYEARINLGKQLAVEHPADAEICVPVPDSGIEAAIGFSKESKIPFEKGVLRAHYAGRTFIQPGQVLRNRKIRMKLSPVSSILRNRSVVIIDDSIVRGNTARRIVNMLREVGTKEIHFRVSSPKIKFPCYYGIDTPIMEELVGNSNSVEEIRKYIGADSLGYLSLEGMKRSIGLKDNCDACFTGEYLI